ncbi:MAG: translation elongation factor Ts [bacterium]|nr:translation elongation factor Ts [bacterium]
MISAQLIKELREKTGAGVSDVKKALEEAKGDTAKAVEIIERKLGSSAGKRAGRDALAGIVEAYVHTNDRLGVMLELFSETDFVARNPGFKQLAHDIALHIAAMRPMYLSLDAVPSEQWDAQKALFSEEANTLNKPANIVEQIIDGKLKAYFGAFSLLDQPFVKDQDKTVRDILNESIGRFGENIKVGRFVRLEM